MKALPVKWKFALSLLGLVTALVWIAVSTKPKLQLKLVACDVGQGDATLAIYGEHQILVDGGPDNSVLDCLGRHIPFWDKEIELVVLTHPQKDHFGGLIEVFERYEVVNLLASSLESSSQDYQVLKKVVGGSKTTVHDVSKVSSMGLGMMHLDILHPEESFIESNSTAKLAEKSFPLTHVLGSQTSSKDLNDFSIVAILRLDEFEALLTGDIGLKISNLVIEKLVEKNNQSIEYIKVPHHGSKNGLTKNLLVESNPEVAVISVGENNWYKHPHEEVIKLLGDQGIKILRTDEMGDVVVVSDGKSWWVEE